jgi:hypothetical protein
MTQQVIDVGNVANDGQGDPLRTAFIKTNDNFTELYNIGGISGIANGTSNISIVEDSTVSISSANVANVFVVSGTGATNLGLLYSNTISAGGNVIVGGLYFGNGSHRGNIQCASCIDHRQHTQFQRYFFQFDFSWHIDQR